MSKFGFVHLVFYASVFGAYVYAFAFDTDLFNSGKYEKVGFPFDNSYGRRAKFLTYINMTMQTVYALMGILLSFGDVVCSKLFSSCIKKNQKSGGNENIWKEMFSFYHSSIIFPIGAVGSCLKLFLIFKARNKIKMYFLKLVSFSFWLIYFVDRNLIYPVILDSIVPHWQNHVMHTLPLASLLLESFLTKHRYPSFIKGFFSFKIFLLKQIF
jgi:hypothetical protein